MVGRMKEGRCLAGWLATDMIEDGWMDGWMDPLSLCMLGEREVEMK